MSDWLMTARLRSVALILVLVLGLVACASDNKTDDNNEPSNNDVPDVQEMDTEEQDAEPDIIEDEPDVVEDEPDMDDGPPPGTICAPCTDNEECGGESDLCLNLPFEETGTCATDCTVSEDMCPEGFDCATVQEAPALVRQCVPEGLLCNNLCEGVECPGGQVCLPLTGECSAPLGLCDQPCIGNETCGGPDDQCVLLGDTGESVCAQDCSEDQTSCPEDYFCANIGQDTGVFQCVPEILTCIDRCGDVNCGDDETCDPITGQCTPLLGLCDLDCTNSALCGGPDDLCLNLSDDESFCATACEDSQDCPLNYFCADLNNREQGACVPISLTCIDDRCDNVDCGEGFNCDERTGECVEVEVQLCEQCGDLPSSACGGPNDLCLNLGDPGGTICSVDCTESGECPNDGYTCVILNNTTRRACIPINQECRQCDGVDCPEGATCNPLTGQCDAPPVSCLIEDCPQGEICNPDTEACEVIGESCNFDTRVADCFGPVRKCSATRPAADGVCAVICSDNDDCTPEAPNCVDLYRVGELCVPDGLGSGQTCGITAPEGADVGRPCGVGVRTPCPVEAPTCIQGVEQDVAGFCSLGCDSDADCGGDGTCQEVRGRDGRFCVPSNCLCLTGNEVPDGENDILAEALAERGLSRCSFSLDPTSQRGLDPATPSAPFKLSSLGGLFNEPLAAPGFGRSLQGELDAALEGDSPVRDSIVAAAARQGVIIEGRQAQFALPDELDPLSEGIRAFVEAAGGDFEPGDITGDVGSVPPEAQGALAQILAAAAEVLTVRQGITDALGLDAEAIEALFQNTPYLLLPPQPGAQAPDLSDEATLARLTGFDRQLLFQAAADLAFTIENANLDPETLSEALISVQTPAGQIMIGNSGDTIYEADQGPYALLIDVDGSDIYRVAAGANTAASQPVGVVIDLGGTDTYSYAQVPDERDQDAWLTSDADGRFAPQRPVQAGNGPVSLSGAARQGAGRLGAGMLFDLGSDNDAYNSLRMSQGAGILGVGVLFDDGGDDVYSAEAFAQGAGLLGVGVLLDAGSNATTDTYRIWHAGQGFGGAAGAGLLIDTEGNSAYTAEPATGLTDVLYFSAPDRGQSNQNLAQGAGAGTLPAEDRFPDRQATGGGVGTLYDLGGDDTYVCGTFGQGQGLHLGVGVLIDAAGNDNYSARYGAQGYGELVALGLLLEVDGDDQYNTAPGRRIGALMGSGNNLGSGFLLEIAGGDIYQVPGFSGGTGQLNGAGALLDLAGQDTHNAVSTSTWGFASLGLLDDDPNIFRNQTPTYGLFIDAGDDEDTYARPDLEDQDPALIGNGQRWAQPFDSSLDTELGIGIDGQGLTGLE